ncbi:LysR family transcriptional regulator [Ensifer sp. Root127]|uniref:LysR family transcriptional regulator n=1 Tax=Ensifer sp. Root127 TaxID=1736440 RepID=UPI00070CC2C7|nr:LysR family transcriptional regulator [Ensifer sp. Root127]KQW82122.1 LuxR family transcriptional regulator [Ensifer sp. Root127]
MPRRFDYLADVEVFVAVAEHGSLTAGAIALGTTPSVVSRAISRLEARLGSQLLRRTTRRIGLTHDGQHFLDQARSAFSTIDDAERAIQGGSRQIAGRIRLSVPTTYGHFRLPPQLCRFRALHPKVEVELNITNRNVDLVAEGFDLAIRMGQLPDSGLVARKIEDGAMCLVAAPDYVARRGTPQSISDLDRHDCVPFVMPSTGRFAPWMFHDNGQDLDWAPSSGGLQVSDDVLGVVSMAEQGAGICQTYDFVVERSIRQGRLIELLPQLNGRTRSISIVYAPNRRLSAASRALIDVLGKRQS